MATTQDKHITPKCMERAVGDQSWADHQVFFFFFRPQPRETWIIHYLHEAFRLQESFRLQEDSFQLQFL